jgi:hypothetical protein
MAVQKSIAPSYSFAKNNFITRVRQIALQFSPRRSFHNWHNVLTCKGDFMPRTVSTATALIVLIAAAFASRLQAQVSPQFNVSINPSIVTVTQGSVTSFTVNIVVNERPQFEFTVSGLPGGIVAQVSPGHPGANTIMLTALPTASTGTFNVHVTTLAGNNPQSQSFTLNVKPLPMVQWEYQVEKAATENDLQTAAARLGQQSWELISVVYRERGSKGLPEWTAFFKREKRPTRGD